VLGREVKVLVRVERESIGTEGVVESVEWFGWY